jgi:hypothetical protein
LYYIKRHVFKQNAIRDISGSSARVLIPDNDCQEQTANAILYMSYFALVSAFEFYITIGTIFYINEKKIEKIYNKITIKEIFFDTPKIIFRRFTKTYYFCTVFSLYNYFSYARNINTRD